MLDVKKLLTKILKALMVSQTVTLTAYNKQWIFRKVGCVVFFDAPNDGKGFPSGSCTIGTLPVGMRPTYTQRINIGNNSNVMRFVNIDASGAVTMYNNTAYPNAVNCAVSSAFIAGGGYFISRILSTTERWWRYVKQQKGINKSVETAGYTTQGCISIKEHWKNGWKSCGYFCTNSKRVHVLMLVIVSDIRLGFSHLHINTNECKFKYLVGNNKRNRHRYSDCICTLCKDTVTLERGWSCA